MAFCKTYGTVLLLMLTVCCIQTVISDTVFDTRKVSGFKWIMNRLTARPELIQEFKERLESGLGRKIEIDPSVTSNFDASLSSSSCQLCKNLFSILKNLIWFGGDYDTPLIKPTLILLCTEVMGSETDGRTMCEPVLDNYAHHVIHIIRQTNKKGTDPMTAGEICTFVNQCESTDGDISTTTSKTVTTTPASTKASTKGPTNKPEATTKSGITDGDTNGPEQTDGPTDSPVTAPEQTDGPTDSPVTAPEQTDGPTDPPVTAPEQTDGPTDSPVTAPEQTDGPTDPPVTAPEQTDGPTDSPVTAPEQTDGPTDSPITAPEQTDGPTDSPITAPGLTNEPTDSPMTAPENTDQQTDSPVTTPEPKLKDDGGMQELHQSEKIKQHTYPFSSRFSLYEMENPQYWQKKNDFINQILRAGPLPMSRKRLQNKRLRHKRHLKKMANAIKIAHVTDFHVDKKYSEGGHIDCDLPVCCRNDSNGNGSAGYWGEAAFCNIPPWTTELFLKFVKDLKPDFVIYSGDNPPHSAWEETQEKQLDITKWVATSVNTILARELEIRAYPAIGNHETNPTNLYSMIDDVHENNTKEFNEVWGESWREAAGFGDEQIKTINKAGYYTMPIEIKDDNHKLRIVSFNSNYGYTDNFYNLIHKNRPEFREMCDWLERTLKDARDNGEKVILLTHHDVGSFENIIDFDEWFTKVLAEYSDIIVFHPVGHTHRDEFRLIFKGDEFEKPAGIVHVGMTMNSWPNVNPGFRIFYLDRSDYSVLDYEQYYIDLKTVDGGAANPEPKVLYQFTKEYGVDDASAKSYLDLWHRMKGDRDLMLKYWFNRRLMSMAEPYMSDEEWKSEICHGVCQSYGRYRECMKTIDMNATTSTTSTTTTPTVTPTTESSASILAMSMFLGIVAAAIHHIQ